MKKEGKNKIIYLAKSLSETLAAYITGFIVNNINDFNEFFSSFVNSTCLTGTPPNKEAVAFSIAVVSSDVIFLSFFIYDINK
jgi:hypothetical protein